MILPDHGSAKKRKTSKEKELPSTSTVEGNDAIHFPLDNCPSRSLSVGKWTVEDIRGLPFRAIGESRNCDWDLILGPTLGLHGDTDLLRDPHAPGSRGSHSILRCKTPNDEDGSSHDLSAGEWFERC